MSSSTLETLESEGVNPHIDVVEVPCVVLNPSDGCTAVLVGRRTVFLCSVCCGMWRPGKPFPRKLALSSLYQHFNKEHRGDGHVGNRGKNITIHRSLFQEGMTEVRRESGVCAGCWRQSNMVMI